MFYDLFRKFKYVLNYLLSRYYLAYYKDLLPTSVERQVLVTPLDG
ncbi:hypothetical protein DFP96_1082 [Listeria rocourtiae]|uniref:Uncharacterized protein n=1 Tax=Listeria rocourtiae TaxID=647910 RepID=A0A4R6ZJ89_9LIST|nr:hypothetical protein DFP96_1082 [Listeria rocourtiae]